jgi:DNA-binding NarL/FixJ family response regulator
VGIGVLICEPHGLIRTGLRTTLDDEDDIRVVAEVTDGPAALDAARREQPDVALLDAAIPGVDSVDLTRQIAQDRGADGTRVVVTGELARAERLVEAVRAGAWGCLLTDGPLEEVVRTVRTVAAGGAVFAPAVARMVLDQIARAPAVAPPVSRSDWLGFLSIREQEVLSLLAEGMSNTEIAYSLSRSEATIKSHISSLLGKLQLRDRLQAVVFAYRSGLVAACPEGSTTTPRPVSGS